MTARKVAKVARIVRITATPGKRAELMELLAERVDHARSEPGTLVYAFHEAAADDTTVWAWELFESAEALEAHRSSGAVTRIRPAIAALTAGDPEVFTLDPRVAKGIDV